VRKFAPIESAVRTINEAHNADSGVARTKTVDQRTGFVRSSGVRGNPAGGYDNGHSAPLFFDRGLIGARYVLAGAQDAPTGPWEASRPWAEDRG
jgi:hypothetical protein